MEGGTSGNFRKRVSSLNVTHATNASIFLPRWMRGKIDYQETKMGELGDAVGYTIKRYLEVDYAVFVQTTFPLRLLLKP